VKFWPSSKKLLGWKQPRRKRTLHISGRFYAATDGDPDPISAGTAGEAALWGGSSAVVGVAATPFGAHQVGPHIADRMICRYATGHDVPRRAGKRSAGTPPENAGVAADTCGAFHPAIRVSLPVSPELV
jgi:hypothetical protein